MGSGVGKAISGMAVSDCQNENIIVLLDQPEKVDHIKRCELHGINVIICPDSDTLMKLVLKADIIVVSWWHHPLLYRFLVSIENTPTRIVLWSHINGLYYPRLRFNFADCFDSCIFTSESTFWNEEWNESEKKYIKAKSGLVYGMGDFRPENFQSKSDYNLRPTIKVGYVGSLDYTKLHPDFVSFLKAAVDSNHNIVFEIAGDIIGAIEKDVERYGLSENVIFLGYRTDIQSLHISWDAFIYLLNPFNFATTENALLEAMASALPIITSSGFVEKSIIRNKETGITVSSQEEFATELNRLMSNLEMRKELGLKARAYVIKNYNIDSNCNRYNDILNNVLEMPKREHCFTKAIGKNAFDWFLSGCGYEETQKFRSFSEKLKNKENEKMILLETKDIKRIYKGDSKGSVGQFSKYNPEDAVLQSISELMKKSQE